ncbi:hypothetical protein WDW37_14675 [Bdellovibrionota bacterium FG-1]
MTRSFETQFEIKAIFCGLATLFCLGFVGTPVARASEVDQALQEWSKAQGDFYLGLRANPNITAQQKEELARQTLTPASEKLTSAMNQQTTKTIQEITEPKGKAAKKSEAKTTVPVEAESQKPEVVLDGSNVPKEIEFPGPKKSGRK